MLDPDVGCDVDQRVERRAHPRDGRRPQQEHATYARQCRAERRGVVEVEGDGLDVAEIRGAARGVRRAAEPVAPAPDSLEHGGTHGDAGGAQRCDDGTAHVARRAGDQHRQCRGLIADHLTAASNTFTMQATYL